MSRSTISPLTAQFANRNYNYGTSVTWTLWDGSGVGAGGSTNNRITDVRYAQAAYDTAQESLTQTWMNVCQDVRNAYTQLGQNIAQRKINGASLAMQKQARDLYTDQYNAGSISIADLNQAQLTLVNVELAYVQNVINVAISRALLDEACGIRE
jgi:outer membrane protein TolC